MKLCPLMLAMLTISPVCFAQEEETGPLFDEERPPEVEGYTADQKFDIYPYLGVAIDNFAASEVNDYLNFEEAGKSKSRETFGISFQYPLYERVSRGDENRPIFRVPSIWVYGQTTHGVRSTDIDCETNEKNPLCVPFGEEILEAKSDPAQRALFLLRTASSLEAMLGMRVDFLSLQGGDATLYAGTQFGFVAVEDDDDDVADVNHISIGARILRGRYRDSYLEIGRGENQLFTKKPNDRSKINARLIVRPRLADASRLLFFAHIVADVDGGDGPDSVQTYLGLAFCPWRQGGCN